MAETNNNPKWNILDYRPRGYTYQTGRCATWFRWWGLITTRDKIYIILVIKIITFCPFFIHLLESLSLKQVYISRFWQPFTLTEYLKHDYSRSTSSMYHAALEIRFQVL